MKASTWRKTHGIRGDNVADPETQQSREALANQGRTRAGLTGEALKTADLAAVLLPR